MVDDGSVERTSREIVLPVLARGVTLEMTFHVMNQETAYKAIIGRPWIHAMRAVPSSFYQQLKGASAEAYQSAISGAKPGIQIEAIKDPDVVEACKSTVEDLDPVLLDNNDSTKKTYIRHNLSEPGKFHEFLTNNADLFAFSHSDMPGIPRDITTHKLNVDPLYPHVQQMKRKFNVAINDAVSEEVDKLLANGSIRESMYPQWVANVVV
ncbi:PREDICTED: uncharacterized protein LOC109239808, partial [Nicotiana attenuata]|uniref:uncharacterized protein LOC109239808 n=1 Tax=Nicotiana attenuata TaxID=49451 RepID=UPI0009053602